VEYSRQRAFFLHPLVEIAARFPAVAPRVRELFAAYVERERKEREATTTATGLLLFVTALTRMGMPSGLDLLTREHVVTLTPGAIADVSGGDEEGHQRRIIAVLRAVRAGAKVDASSLAWLCYVDDPLVRAEAARAFPDHARIASASMSASRVRASGR